MTDSIKPIIVSQFFNCDRSTVWKAITEWDQMIMWFFENIPDFKANIGFYTEFSVFSSSNEFIHCWNIIDVIPEQLITYDWTYKKIKGQGYVSFSLQEVEDGTKLSVSFKGIDTFPKDIPEFTTESCKKGWEYFIQDRLANYLDSF